MHAPMSLLTFCATLMIGAAAAQGAPAADIPSHCIMPTVAAIKVMTQRAPDLRIFEFLGEDAKAGIRIFNALPPVGHAAGDRFYIVIDPAIPVSRLLIAQRGCLKSVSIVDSHLAMAIKTAIETTAANEAI